MTDNTRRANLALASLNAFAPGEYQGEPPATKIADLICNLLHLADAYNVDIKDSDLLGRTLNNYRAELAEDGPKAELLPEPAPEVAIKCPHCADGELICVEDATITRKVLGYQKAFIGSWLDLSIAEDVNGCGEDRTSCNSCDTTFSTNDVKAIVDGTFTCDDDQEAA